MIAVGPRACWSERLMRFCQSMSVFSSADSLCPTEQALWLDQQDDDEHEERSDELELGRDHNRRHLDEHSDDEGSDHGAPDRPQAAQDHGGEDEQQDLEADLVVPTLGQ